MAQKKYNNFAQRAILFKNMLFLVFVRATIYYKPFNNTIKDLWHYDSLSKCITSWCVSILSSSVDHYVILVGRWAAALPPRSSFLCAHHGPAWADSRPARQFLSAACPQLLLLLVVHAGYSFQAVHSMTDRPVRQGKARRACTIIHTHLLAVWFHEHPL